MDDGRQTTDDEVEQPRSHDMKAVDPHYCLTRIVEALEARAAWPGVANSEAHQAAEAALFLGEPKLAKRALAANARHPDHRGKFRLLSEVTLPWRVSAKLNNLKQPAALEKAYPQFTDECALEMAYRFKCDHSVAACFEGRYEAAFEESDSDYGREIVALTAAVLGEFDRARQFASDPRMPDFRQRSVKEIIATELIRSGQMVEAAAQLYAVDPDDPPEPYITTNIAFALLGRRPWYGYPYPDW